MLPVEQYKERIQELVLSRHRLVFTAPPGSGKSTMLPLFLAEMPELPGEIVVLQPRRLAARMLAAAVAEINNFTVGQEVGYQVRGEKKRSHQTRVSYRTDGLFLRQLINGTELENISAVILDEFHERSWQSDLTLSIVVELQKKMKNLRLVVMSATMETEKLASFLNAPLLVCESATYPVKVHYRHFSRNVPLWERAVKTLEAHLNSSLSKGNILIFMPGGYEISKTVNLCKSFKNIEVCALHGSMSVEQQDRALKAGARQKVIVCTNIAETSLTVEAVDTVIDAGYARLSRYDLSKGIDTLNLEAISLFSADQRAGRSGRLGPGTCYRLWSREEQSRKLLSTPPEIFRVDLSEVLLQAIAYASNIDNFQWYETPDQKSMAQSVRQLQMLGAINKEGLSEEGYKMAAFPAHPRISRFLMEAQRNSCCAEACFWAAILAEKSPLGHKVRLDDKETPSADLGAIAAICRTYSNASPAEAQKMAVRYKLSHSTLQALNRAAQQFKRLLAPAKDSVYGSRRNVVKSLLVSFNDRLGVKVDRGTLRYRFAKGKVAELTRSSAVRDADYIIAIEVIEINSSGSSKVLIASAVEAPYDLLEETFLEQFEFKNELSWNSNNRVVELVETIVLNELILKQQTINKSPVTQAVSNKLAEKVLDGTLNLPGWNAEVKKWIEKVHWVAGVFPEKNIHRYTDSTKTAVVRQFCDGCRSFKEIKNVSVIDYFKNVLSWEEQQFVEQMTPNRIELPNGKKVKIKYEKDKLPRVSGMIQDFYGVDKTPTVAGGRVKVVVELLAPNRRPVHVTDDLEGFWGGVYKDIKSQLAGRYPKHKWL